MSTPYAKGTSVGVDRSQQEIGSILRRYGVKTFGTMEDEGTGYVRFRLDGIEYQVKVPLPDIKEFSTTETGRLRKASATAEAHEQAVRERWRTLVLWIKAQLAAVDAGLVVAKEVFLPFVVMPDGRALSEHILPQLDKVAATGQLRIGDR